MRHVSDQATDKPALRADAERNRQKLLAAAKELFAECGLDVTLDDIARHAGVGTGTAYRRFPNKAALIDELIAERIAAMVALAEAGLEADDPIDGIRTYVTGVLELQIADRSVKQVLFSSERGRERVAAARARLAPAVTRLIERAKAAGAVRDDVLASDVAMTTLMLSTVVDFSRDVEPTLYERYVDVLLDGLRPGRPAPAQPALDMERFHPAMEAYKLGAPPRPSRC